MDSFEVAVDRNKDESSLEDVLLTASDHFEAGRADRGKVLLADLLTTRCSSVDEWHLVMKTAIQYGQPELAATALESLLHMDSIADDFWTSSARIFSDLGSSDVVESAFRGVISMYPREAGLIDCLGALLVEQSRPEAAIELYSSFLSGIDSFEDSYLLGDIFMKLSDAYIMTGRNEEAIETLLTLFSFRPDHPGINYSMGVALKNLKDFEQAVEFFRKALPERSYDLDTIQNIGDCFRRIDRPDLAVEEYQEALARHPEGPLHQALLLNLGQMYFRLGQNDRAISIFRGILRDDPEQTLVIYLLLTSMSVSGYPEVALMKDTARSLWSSYRKNQAIVLSTDNLRPQHEAKPSETVSDGRVKVAILSSEIGEHVVGFFLAPLLENYDKSRFSIDLISVRDWDDNRTVYLNSLADASFRLAGIDEVEARKLIKERQYDIIIETSGYTHSPSLFILAERCAKIQCHYIGFHATTGLDTIDYFIGDSEILPEGIDPEYSESLWRLPRLWLARSYSDGVPIAKSTATHDGPVFGCFSTLLKVNQETLEYWGLALSAVPDSILVIKDRLTGVPHFRDMILTTLAGYGIEAHRVTFLGITMGWQQHMNYFNGIDIAFDTTPWSGATTAFDTLSMGVPLIGIRGRCTSARMSTSVLRAINAESWISQSPEEFAAIALNLAKDYQNIRAEKERLQHEVLNSQLFDSAGLTRELENAFVGMLSAEHEKSGM